MSLFAKTDFIGDLKSCFKGLADGALSSLQAGEEVSVSIDAEDSLYLRFNANRVRQNTDVRQIVFNLRLQSNGRTTQVCRTISGDLKQDLPAVMELLKSARAEIQVLPVDPHQVPMQNNGKSSKDFRGQLLSAEEAVAAIAGPAEGLDLAGIYCGGAVITANRNSLGQDHWFATETYFMDYSLFSGEKAAKSVYAGNCWDAAEWTTNLSRTSNQLSLLHKPVQKVPPGKYRTYLAPGAVSEILSMMSWGALSASAWKQGRSAFKKLADGEVKLSPKFSFRENFGLGLTASFNGLGEVSEEVVPLIENGKITQMLVSSRTAKEFGLRANAADESEGPRSPELMPGSLKEADVLKALGTGLYLSNLHYLNWSDPVAARVTGMTRYACFWVENGEIVGPIKDLRFDESLFEAFGEKLMDLTSHSEIDPAVMTYGARQIGGRKNPGALIEGMSFTL